MTYVFLVGVSLGVLATAGLFAIVFAVVMWASIEKRVSRLEGIEAERSTYALTGIAPQQRGVRNGQATTTAADDQEQGTAHARTPGERLPAVEGARARR